jgi:hypothetical protein
MENKVMATKVFKVKKFLSLTLAFAVLIGLVSSQSAHAQDCRTVASVVASAVSGANNGMQGHINKHIFQAVAPALPGNSAMGATLYDPVADWNAVWNAYQAVPMAPVPNCGANHNNIAAPAVLAPLIVNGHTCTAVLLANNTQCTAMAANVFAPTDHMVVFAWR